MLEISGVVEGCSKATHTLYGVLLLVIYTDLVHTVHVDWVLRI